MTRKERLLILIPVVCEFVTSTLHFFALNFIPGSAYQMIMGGNIVATFLFSTLLL